MDTVSQQASNMLSSLRLTSLRRLTQACRRASLTWARSQALGIEVQKMFLALSAWFHKKYLFQWPYKCNVSQAYLQTHLELHERFYCWLPWSYRLSIMDNDEYLIFRDKMIKLFNENKPAFVKLSRRLWEPDMKACLYCRRLIYGKKDTGAVWRRTAILVLEDMGFKVTQQCECLLV